MKHACYIIKQVLETEYKVRANADYIIITNSFHK